MKVKCAHCNTETDNPKYCNNKCQVAERKKIKIKQLLEAGCSTTVNHRTARQYFIIQSKNTCQICGLSKWLNEPIPLVLDHIDGNPTNNALSNFRVICNNCDAISPFYKSKNRGNGRHARRERYKDGKSF